MNFVPDTDHVIRVIFKKFVKKKGDNYIVDPKAFALREHRNETEISLVWVEYFVLESVEENSVAIKKVIKNIARKERNPVLAYGNVGKIKKYFLNQFGVHVRITNNKAHASFGFYNQEDYREDLFDKFDECNIWKYDSTDNLLNLISS